MDLSGVVDAVASFVLPAATLVAWLVRLVGSLRRRDAGYGTAPVLGATVLALVLLVASFVLPQPPSTLGLGRLGPGDVLAVNALATLVLVLALAVLEVPLWGVRSLVGAVRARRLRAEPATPTPSAAPAMTPQRTVSPAPVSSPAATVAPVVAPAALMPDEAA